MAAHALVGAVAGRGRVWGVRGGRPGKITDGESTARARALNPRPLSPLLSPISISADAVLVTSPATDAAPALTIRTVGSPHIHGTARTEDGRASLDLAVRGAWSAAAAATSSSREGGGGEASAATAAAPPPLCGSYAIPRIGDDPEFAGGIGPLSPELTADGEGSDGAALARVLVSLPAALGEAVKAAVHAGLGEAGGA